VLGGLLRCSWPRRAPFGDIFGVQLGVFMFSKETPRVPFPFYVRCACHYRCRRGVGGTRSKEAQGQSGVGLSRPCGQREYNCSFAQYKAEDRGASMLYHAQGRDSCDDVLSTSVHVQTSMIFLCGTPGIHAKTDGRWEKKNSQWFLCRGVGTC